MFGGRGGRAAAAPAVNPLATLVADRATLASAPSGTYTVRVDIHEVTELTALNMSNTSDPFVVVNVAGQVQRTEVVKEVTAAEFTDSFLFELNVRHPPSELALQARCERTAGARAGGTARQAPATSRASTARGAAARVRQAAPRR